MSIKLCYNSSVLGSNQYKCGVFLEDLTEKRHLTWLGAPPDALKRVSEEEYREILGPGIEPESFENFDCDLTAANARCYATVRYSTMLASKYYKSYCVAFKVQVRPVGLLREEPGEDPIF